MTTKKCGILDRNHYKFKCFFVMDRWIVDKKVESVCSFVRYMPVKHSTSPSQLPMKGRIWPPQYDALSLTSRELTVLEKVGVS